MEKQEKATLNILIHEVQELKPNARIKALLKTWIDANGLHPEEVETINIRNFMKAGKRYADAWNAYWDEVAKNKKMGILHLTKNKNMFQFGIFATSKKEKRLKEQLDKAGEELKRLAPIPPTDKSVGFVGEK